MQYGTVGAEKEAVEQVNVMKDGRKGGRDEEERWLSPSPLQRPKRKMRVTGREARREVRDGGGPLDDDDDNDEQALKRTDGRSNFRCRRRQIPYLPNPINVELIASNRLSGRPRPSVRPGTWRP